MQQPEQAWRKHAGQIPNFGFSQSAYWFRIELQANEPLRWLLDIDYPLLDEITLYTFAGARALQTVQTGDSRPYVDRPLKHVAFDMPLELPSGEPVTVYLRVKSTGTVQVPLMLWQQDAYLEHYEAVTTIQGIYFGIVLIMIFYNLLLYLMVRERAYIHYVLFVAMIGLFTAGLYGWGYKYLWPEAVRFQQYNIAVFISLSTIFGSRFIHHFLDLSHTAPRIGYLLFGVVLSQLAVLFLLPALGFHLGIQIVLALTFVTAVTTLYAGILLWRHGVHTARYFTSAWGLFLFSVLLATLERFGFLPSMFWTALLPSFGHRVDSQSVIAGAGRSPQYREDNSASRHNSRSSSYRRRVRKNWNSKSKSAPSHWNRNSSITEKQNWHCTTARNASAGHSRIRPSAWHW